MDLAALRTRLRRFAAERDWDQFHSPKNLAMALSAEAAELVEVFQWLSQEQSADLSDADRASVKEEVGDVLIYLIRICDKLEIDLERAALDKIDLNERKYPADVARGNATKYNRRENLDE